MVLYDFCTIDFETANNAMNSACSVGIAAVIEGEIVKKEYFLIKPPTNHFRHENTEINGISLEDVKDAKTFDEIFPEILKYIAYSRFVIAHNAQFDMTVIHECAKHYEISVPDFEYLDSINLTSKVSSCGNSLTDCCNYFNVSLDNHHNALSDALATAEIIISALRLSGHPTIDEYIDSYSGIRVKLYSELKPTRTMVSGKGFNGRVKVSEVAAETDNFDTTHPFYGKSFVLTGDLKSLDRKSAMQAIVNIGGVMKSGVSKKTDYLIVGQQDKKIVGEDGLSTKEEKAYALIEQGCDIKILKEDEFLSLL